MRVGIISMQRIFNYGSLLQAFSLKSVLESRGHTVTFVDIESSPKVQVKRKGFDFSKLKYVDKYLFRRLKYSKKNKLLNVVFRENQEKYLGLTQEHMGSDGCDAVVIGSDEIFNCAPDSKWGVTAQRFGYIPGVDLVVSYAASCGYTGVEYLTEQDRKVIKAALENMKGISVRDQNTADFVLGLTGRQPNMNLDPVLIYDQFEAQYAPYEGSVPKEPYMVVYAYHNRIDTKEEIEAIQKYAKKHHLKTIAIGGSLPWCDDFAVLSPFEVLAYFKHAACIVTDTFHGTIFSAKLRKPFAVIVRDSNKKKLDDLLTRLKITNHKVADMSRLERVLEQKDDLNACHEVIAEGREQAYRFLESVGL